MPAKIIRFLLTLSSIAPIGVVLLAGLLSAGELNRYYAVVVGVPVLLLVVLAWLLCVWALRRMPVDVLAVDEARSADRDALGFLLAYALPVITLRSAHDLESFNGGALSAFVFLALVVVYKLNLLHVNPLLGLIGFHFYEIKAKSGRTYLFVGKGLGADGDQVRVHWLSPDVCLEARDEQAA